jgi:hypothetical protein
MVHIHQLPDDVLISIFQQTWLPTFLSLRRSSKSLYELVNSYITAIVPSVARNTFRDTTPRILNRAPANGKRDIEWLLQLIPEYLAAVILDRHATSMGALSRQTIPAADELGDGFRARVADGFRVMMELSRIAKEVYDMPQREVEKLAVNVPKYIRRLRLAQQSAGSNWYLPKREPVAHNDRPRLLQRAKATATSAASQALISKPSRLIKQRESIITERRITYLHSIWITRPTNFSVTYAILSQAFFANYDPNFGDQHPFFNPIGKVIDFFDWGSPLHTRVYHGNSWVTWWILHEGPLTFWHQWCPPVCYDEDRHDYIRGRLLSDWDRRSEEQIGNERDAVSTYMNRVYPHGQQDAKRNFERYVSQCQDLERQEPEHPRYGSSRFIYVDDDEEDEEEDSWYDEYALYHLPYLINFKGKPPH